MTRRHLFCLSAAAAVLAASATGALAAGFTIPEVLGAPFASDLVAAPEQRAFAWVSNARGARNVWLARPKRGSTGFEARVLTHYVADDGLEVSGIAFVPHHEQLLYVLGGDVEYPDKPAPNPAQLTAGVEEEIYLVDFSGGRAVKLGDGHAPSLSPDGGRILYLHEGKVLSVAPRKGARAEELFKVRGGIDSLRFSPDGRH